MTAMNLIVQQRARAALLLTDTAAIVPDTGKVAGFQSKVIPVDVDGRTVAAVAFSDRVVRADLEQHVEAIAPTSLQDFLDRFPEAFRATEQMLQARGAEGSMAAVVAAFDH